MKPSACNIKCVSGKLTGGRVGKRKVKSEDEFKVTKLPEANDVIGIAKRMLGFGRVLVSCQDHLR